MIYERLSLALVSFVRASLLVALVLAMPTQSFADEGDDALRRILSKSDLVVEATVLTDPYELFLQKGDTYEYICGVQMLDALKGEKPNVELGVFSVFVIRRESSEKDRLPYLKKGSKCIFFLKNEGTEPKPSFKTVDVWFGVQPANSKLSQWIKRLE